MRCTRRRPSGPAPLALSLFLTALAAVRILSSEPAPAAGEGGAARPAPLAAAPLGAPEAARTMAVPEGFQVTVFASEPDVEQPIGMSWDERGRLWVAECLTYAEQKVNFDLDRHDRIKIFEDIDGDGRFDRKKVFWDRAQRLTSVAVGFGGVWALCAPTLLFIPDRDRDDVPDGEPEVVLDGWNDGPVRHNIVNGLLWGPDGWLYGRHGIQATSVVGRPGTPPSRRVKLNCSIWRYHPLRKTFEVITHGTTNPWGLDYDDHGQMFFINTVIGHLWHVVPGAHYRRMYGADFDPHVFELIDQCADHYHWDRREASSDIRKGLSTTTSQAGGGHAHSGLMIYLGGSWPQPYRNTLFTVNLHGQRLNNDRLERGPASYVGRHGLDFLFARDPWFRAVEITYGPGGNAYLADWSDTGECHETDAVHRASGRIYRIACGPSRRAPGGDLGALGDTELAGLQLHPNDWYVRQARRLLQERALAGEDVSGARQRLLEIFALHPEVTRKLRALWCLHAMEALEPSWLLEQLDHAEEHVRLWAVRLVTDRGDPGPEAAARLARRAVRESSGLVRLFLASAMQKLPPAARWDLAFPLAGHGEDAQDRMLPLMLWYGIEPAVAGGAARAVDLAVSSRLPLLARHIARRLTLEVEHSPEAVDRLLQALREHQDLRFRREVLRGMTDALRGWRKAPAPAAWPEAAAELARSEDPAVRQATRELGLVFGDGRALEELRELVSMDGADAEARRSALRALVAARAEDLVPLLRRLVGDKVLSSEAVRGLAAFGDPRTPDLLLERYGELDPAGQEQAIATLASRPAYARALLAAVAADRVARRDISAYQARQIRSFADPELERRLERLWGRVRETEEEKRARIAELEPLATPERLARADLRRGRSLFDKLCASCHTLYGVGGEVAPDLTGSNRRDVAYLLENIVDPSAVMVEDYKVSVVILRGGRVITGVVVERNERTLAVQTQEERLHVDAREVERVVPEEVSLMPEGLLAGLSEGEIVDLLAYLAGERQVEPAPPGSLGGAAGDGGR